MLTEAQLEIIESVLIPLFQYLEHEVIVDVAKRISDSLSYTRTAELKAIAMRELGYSPAKIRKEAMKLLNSDAEFRKKVAKNTLEHKREVRKILNTLMKDAYKANDKIMADAGNMAWVNDLSIWKDNGKQLTDSSFLSQLVRSFSMQTAGELRNLTQTTGFQTMSGYEAIENLYKRELDKAIIKICTGTFSKERVVADTIHNLAKSGLRSVDFASGYSMQLDTAVRLALRTGAHQLATKITDMNIEQTGENLVYVSKHWGARNKGTGHANHEQWQGKVYYIKQGSDYKEETKRIGQDRIESLWEATGYSVDGAHENDPLGLNGYNCRHNYYPWFEGASELPNEEPEPQPATYNGKTYDYYAMTQKMRSMERSVRALKREKEAIKALDMDTKEIDAKIRRKTAQYNEFCDACKVKPKTERFRYECRTSELNQTEAWKELKASSENSKNTIANSQENVTMDIAKEEKGIEVHSVGKIDKDIYKCITEDIVTDEVVITDKQLNHIIERHPEAYHNALDYVSNILQAPDYIIRDSKRTNTGLIVKRISEESEQLLLVLRICTAEEPAGYKNSIITSWEISEKRLRNYLRNKDILYKKE